MKERLTVLRMVVIGVTLLAGVFLLYLHARSRPGKGEEITKAIKSKRRNLLLLGVLSLWLCSGFVMGIFSHETEGLTVQMTSPRMNFLGFDISSSVVISWMAMIVVIVPVVLIRLFVIPKFSDSPSKIQYILETAVSTISDYTREKSDIRSNALNAYILTLALYLVGCAFTELFSFRPPTSDIVATFSLSLVTFIMINYYGLKRKGVGGRLSSFAKPIPVVFPFRVLSDIAAPISLACRLFGNMLGGMIVMHLIYQVLGAFGVGIPAVLGLYFNVFHPLIQVFIFITLSLTFIGEAVESN